LSGYEQEVLSIGSEKDWQGLSVERARTVLRGAIHLAFGIPNRESREADRPAGEKGTLRSATMWSVQRTESKPRCIWLASSH
jgi:hypothetical protein